ncbi:MAG: sugar phosphate nucleotidyltransferase [Promethearchaeota archaeon]
MRIICPIAGIGSYLQPFIVSKPKALMKIAGKPIIAHSLEKLSEIFPKDTKICFIVGYKKRLLMEFLIELNETMENYFDIEFVEQKSVGIDGDLPRFSGIGDALALTKEFGANEDCFIFFSDRLPTSNYQPLLSQFQLSKADGIFNVQEVEDPENYGVCVLNKEGFISKVYEKPDRFYSNLATQGAFIISKNISERFFTLLENQAKGVPSRYAHSYSPIIQQLIDEGSKFEIHIMLDKILDFGSIDKFIEGNRILLASPSITKIENQDSSLLNLPLKVEISNSTILQPVFLGENVNISNCVIGPNVSVGNNTVITRSILSNSVVGDCSTLENLNTNSSIIGDYVQIENLVKNRISIGDASSIMLTKNL